GKLRDRLGAGSEQERLDAASGAQPRGSSFAPILHKVGQVAAKPFMPKTREAQSGLRNRLGHAGIYQPSAVRAVQAAKVICLAGGLIGGYVAGVMMKNMLMGLSFGGLIGYLAPTFWLKHMVKRNQQSLNYGLPDALDLMVVCVEAGLTVDAAMQRVGQELSIAHPSVSREFGIAHMETRVGLTRSDALKNLGIRTGNAALQSLSAMLVQAERFGTSIATALRIHAETLRTNRQHAAEEMAAKASVKMSFPLVLFIFPSTFIVLAGPTVVQLMNANW
ncbi:MAG: type II secretion system F family protein, partial [Tepidisphaeraceae bacterium]